MACTYKVLAPAMKQNGFATHNSGQNRGFRNRFSIAYNKGGKMRTYLINGASTIPLQ